MYEDKILEQYTEKEDIKRIFKLVIKNKIIKTEHFYRRILERDVSEELVDKTLHKLEIVKLIDKRRHTQDVGYDLYYDLSGNRTLKLCFIPVDNKILLINAILRNRKWQGSIRFLNKRS